MSDKIKYIVTSKFAHFSVGQIIHLDAECPAAAKAHVRPFVEGETDSKDKKNQDATDGLKDIYSLVTGKDAGKTGPKKLVEGIKEALQELMEGKTIAEE